jgi:type II secretory pathway component PulF
MRHLHHPTFLCGTNVFQAHSIENSTEIFMFTSQMIPALFLFTLLAVVLIAGVAYVMFLRKRGNRRPVEHPSLAGKTMAPTRSDQTR